MYVYVHLAANVDNQNKLTYRPINTGRQTAQQQKRQLQQPHHRQPTDKGTKQTTKALGDSWTGAENDNTSL